MSSFLLKIFAIITMTIDHIGLAFFNNNSIFRIIGRIAMPIFAFQIAIGFRNTHSKSKYIFRIFLLALISELPFNLMLQSTNYATSSLNICYTFTLALIALLFIDLGKKNKLFYLISILPVMFSELINMDYGIYAILLVLIFYFFQNNKIMLTYGFVATTFLYYLIEHSTIQCYMMLALPFILLYNGQKGKSLKYLFYAFYPLHMLIIALIVFHLNAIKF